MSLYNVQIDKNTSNIDGKRYKIIDFDIFFLKYL